MDLALLDETLAELGQPAFRSRQVWEWTARGASGYDAMTNVPADLRATLAERVPFSTLSVESALSRRAASGGTAPDAVGAAVDDFNVRVTKIEEHP